VYTAGRTTIAVPLRLFTASLLPASRCRQTPRLRWGDALLGGRRAGKLHSRNYAGRHGHAPAIRSHAGAVLGVERLAVGMADHHRAEGPPHSRYIRDATPTV
jgi:hypothetical protein